MIMVLIRGGIETLQLGTYYYIYILATYLIVLKEKLVFLDHLPHSLKSRNRWVFHNSEVRSPGICFLSYVSSSLQQVSSYFHDMFFPRFPSQHFILPLCLLPPGAFLAITFSCASKISVPLKLQLYQQSYLLITTNVAQIFSQLKLEL